MLPHPSIYKAVKQAMNEQSFFMITNVFNVELRYINVHVIIHLPYNRLLHWKN